MRLAIRLAVLLVLAMSSQGLAEERSSTATSPAVLQYLGERAGRLAAVLAPIPDDRAAWEQRRQVVRRELAGLLGLPGREPMRAKVLGTRVEGGLVVEEVTYLWAERAYVSANVVRPKGVSGRLPALVVPPGWLGQLELECYKTFVAHTARNGYLLLFIDDPHVGKRLAPCAGLYAAASAAGTQVMGIQVFDALRGLDYLATRADVDLGRIGMAGLCQGSEQTWLAAALEDRFQIAVPVCGTTTYEDWARMPWATSVHLSDPSPYVAGVLRKTDWHEINACIAPRPVYIASNSGDNWWPVRGYDKVVATLDKVFRLYGKPEQFQHLRVLRSHSMTPFIPELSPWIDVHLKGLTASSGTSVPPAAEPVDADFSMLHYAQRRIARQTEALPAAFADREAWEGYRRSVAAWLRQACDVAGLRPGEPKRVSSRSADGLLTELVEVPQDEGLAVPVTLLASEPRVPGRRPTVILSHDSGQCAGDSSLLRVAKALAADGCVVAVPEHASPNAASRRHVGNISSLYGVSDTVGLPPVAMRVWDDLAALECLLRRPEVAKGQVVMVGLGVGGVDAALAAALDDRIAALGVVGAGTVRDWAELVAPNLGGFDRILPYLPEITVRTDLQFVYSAAAPRPLLLVDATDRANWPQTGYRRVRKTAEHVYVLCGASKAVTATAANSPWGVEELRAWLANGVRTRAE